MYPYLSLSKQNVLNLPQQINQFVTVRENLIASLGHESTKALLGKSLFCISTGSNDIFVYFKTRSTMPKEEFINYLMEAYENHIKVGIECSFNLHN